MISSSFIFFVQARRLTNWEDNCWKKVHRFTSIGLGYSKNIIYNKLLLFCFNEKYNTKNFWNSAICDVTKIKKQLKMLHFLNIYPYFIILCINRRWMTFVRQGKCYSVQHLRVCTSRCLLMSPCMDETTFWNIWQQWTVIGTSMWFTMDFLFFYLHRGGQTSRGGGISRGFSKNINSEKVCSSP